MGVFPGCLECGLTLGVLDAVNGTGEVVVERVNDISGVLGESGRSLLGAEVARLEACFPQVFVVVHLSALGSVPALRQFGFWLLNRAALAGGSIMRPNENGVLVLIDPTGPLAGLRRLRGGGQRSGRTTPNPASPHA